MSLNVTPTSPSYDPVDAMMTMEAIRANIHDKRGVKNLVMGFVARNFGARRFTAEDLRTALGYAKDACYGPEGESRLDEVARRLSQRKHMADLLTTSGRETVKGVSGWFCYYSLTPKGVAHFVKGHGVADLAIGTDGALTRAAIARVAHDRDRVFDLVLGFVGRRFGEFPFTQQAFQDGLDARGEAYGANGKQLLRDVLFHIIGTKSYRHYLASEDEPVGDRHKRNRYFLTAAGLARFSPRVAAQIEAQPVQADAEVDGLALLRELQDVRVVETAPIVVGPVDGDVEVITPERALALITKQHEEIERLRQQCLEYGQTIDKLASTITALEEDARSRPVAAPRVIPQAIVVPRSILSAARV
jgi:hypothetical protein